MSAQDVYWILSPRDSAQAHAVSDTDELVTRCGSRVSAAAGLDEVPRASLCPSCALAVAPGYLDRAALVQQARETKGGLV